jgi:preprotein translocase subunit SecA
MANFLTKFLGNNEREVGKLQQIVNKINKLETEFENLSDTDLRNKTAEFRSRLAESMTKYPKAEIFDEEADADHIVEEEQKRLIKYEQEQLDKLLPEAFAAVREAAKRTIKKRHYDVQMLGGIVLHQGKIAEMKTGEGKTLVATLPLYLNALLGKGAHLVTVNDFLAKYHAQWMGEVYDALGMSTAAIEHDKSWLFNKEVLQEEEAAELEEGVIDTDWPHLRSCNRQEAYAADITYGTNNEFGFDYLRDNMVFQPQAMVQRGHRFAIVDEVDSILIDEARTPLIISAPAEESASLYSQYAALATKLKIDEHYTVNEKDRVVAITDAGIAEVERLTGLDNFYDAQNIVLVHHLESALKAKALFRKDKDYVVRDNEIIIVDEFTGRMMEGRRYSEGLHQAIEAKEGVEVKRESDTLATVSFQNLFRMYDKLAGMTGTAETEAEEFWKIYQLDVVQIPTHRPMVRIDSQDKIYKNEMAKYRAVVADVKARNEKGQPVLIGTISVEKNEMLSKLLKEAGIKHEVLNAKFHEKEATIIAQAGRKGAVTVATNMAGRGVDIILGGNPPVIEESREVQELGGLHVIGTERHESRRIDNQLRGRAGRQGDPGSSIFYVCMDDDLMRIFGGDKLRAVMERLGLPEDEAIEHKMISNSLEQAQKRVEGHNFDIRKHLVEYDDVMNKHRIIMYRKRRAVLALDPLKDDWLHEDVLAMLSDEEVPAYEAKLNTFGLDVMKQVERVIHLRVIDTLWINHLNTMQELRDGIGLRGYGQRDPLIEYKHEAYNIFQRLLQSIDDEVVSMILKTEVAQQNVVPEQPVRNMVLQGADESMAGGALTNVAAAEAAAPGAEPVSPVEMQQSAPESTSNVKVSVRQAGAKSEPIKAEHKVGRNDPCPCGSGLKYKKCHGK